MTWRATPLRPLHVIMRRGCHAMSLLTRPHSCHVTCQSRHVIARVTSTSACDVAATPCHCQRVFWVIKPCHLSCQLYKRLHTWTWCKWRPVFRPHVTSCSYYAVVNNFQLWHGVHVVDDGVLSSSHLFDKWLISYSFTTTNQSRICPTLSCADWSHRCWVFHSVVM
jgi:hypothetical protein